LGLTHAVLLACLGFISAPHAVLAADVTLTETGSTLLLPLFDTWVTNYTKTHTGVTILTGGTGSEHGIKEVSAGRVEIGASDAYMSDAQIRKTPDIMNIALAIAAQTSIPA